MNLSRIMKPFDLKFMGKGTNGLELLDSLFDAWITLPSKKMGTESAFSEIQKFSSHFFCQRTMFKVWTDSFGNPGKIFPIEKKPTKDSHFFFFLSFFLEQMRWDRTIVNPPIHKWDFYCLALLAYEAWRSFAQKIILFKGITHTLRNSGEAHIIRL